MSMKIFSDLRILNLCVCGQWIAVSMNKFYPFQLWLTTLGIGPILYVLYGLLSSNQNEASEIFALYPLFLIIGLIYSIPLFLIFYIFFRLFAQLIPSSLAIKAIADILLVIGVFITFKVISGSEALNLSIAYSFGIIMSSTFFKIKEPKDRVII
jgi:hypothetical protein